jgi:hypothetical protein
MSGNERETSRASPIQAHLAANSNAVIKLWNADRG